VPFCPDCGTEVSEDTRFCPECGRPLAAGEVVKGKSRKKLVGIIVACIVAILLIAVLARPPSSPVMEAPPLEEGWIRLRIADVGSIDYPPDFLELQSSDYREFVEDLVSVYEIPSSDFILQKVGLNELELSAFEEYRRVILETSYLNPGEEVFRANKKYTMTQQELAEIRDELVSDLSQEFDRQRIGGAGNNRIIDPSTLEITEVNGMFPLVWTYKRQLDDNPIVLAKVYIFMNYDRVHHLLFSCRVVDEEECRDIYENMLDSFRL
jgi:predicted nucleic acid-binding Zn ribbon protein